MVLSDPRPTVIDVDTLFQPPADTWHRLSPKYATVQTVSSVIWNLVVWVPLVTAAFSLLPSPWPWVVAAVALGWTVWRVVRAGRYARSWAYAERGEDLCITRGLWFKSLTVVPYGRLQIAKVDSGPVQRAMGLATVTLVTASAQSNASIPGLPAGEAERLRDRLIEIGDTRGAGL